MTKIAIKAAKIFTSRFIEKEKYLLLEDNKFAGFISKEEALKQNIEIKEFPNSYILPGLIDTHIHGAVGCDTMDATPEALQKSVIIF